MHSLGNIFIFFVFQNCITLLYSVCMETVLRRTGVAELLIEQVAAGTDSPETKRAYRRGARRFAEWLAEAPRRLETALADYREVILSRPGSYSRRNTDWVAAKHFFRRLCVHNQWTEHLATVSQAGSIPRTPASVGVWLTQVQAQQLIDSLDGVRLRDVRDRALITVLLGSALRRSELSALQIEDVVQLEGRPVLHNIRTKGGRIRTIPLPVWACDAVQAWAGRLQHTSGPLWYSISKAGEIGRPGLSGVSILNVLKARCRAAGVPEIRPHDGRRTFAGLALHAGANSSEIREALGHRDLATTEHYLRPLTALEDPPCDRLPLCGGA